MKPILRRRPSWAVWLFALASVCATSAWPAAGAERGPLRTPPAAAPAETEARVIVKYKADSALMRALSVTSASSVGPLHAGELGTRLGLSLTDGRAIGERTQVVRGTGLGSAELAAQLAAQPDVEFAEVDERKYALAVTINDPLYLNAAGTQSPASGQWYLQTPTSTLVSAINAPGAWAITIGRNSVVVADLDTGVRADHPDLTNKLVAGRNFVSTNGTSQTGWSADPSDPGDYTTTTNQCGDGAAPQSSSWHGTQTAGLIGAQTNNGIGMASIGHEVMIQPLRVLGTCGGYDSDIQAAMLWAGGISVPGLPVNPTPARVINMSLGSKGTCSSNYQSTINQLAALAQPVVVVVAAGNDGLALGTPANCTGVVSVVGVRHTGTKVGYSDLGPNATISAPAGNCVNATGACLYPILTTTNTGTTTPVAGAAGAAYTDGLNNPSLGTSFATPLVTGTVALMVSANPSLTPSQVTSYLQSSARPFPSTGAAVGVSACTAPTATAQNGECYCTTSTCGAGLLDAGRAVAAVATATATITEASTALTAGTAVTLDGSSSTASAGATISSYLWTITSGSGIASFTSATNAASVTLLPSAAGTVVVSLEITDSTGRQASTSVTLTVAAGSSATAPTTPTTPTTSSGGGGGAIGLGWLLGWLASLVGVAAVTPRGRRR